MPANSRPLLFAVVLCLLLALFTSCTVQASTPARTQAASAAQATTFADRYGIADPHLPLYPSTMDTALDGIRDAGGCRRLARQACWREKVGTVRTYTTLTDVADTLPANSRRTYSMADKLPNSRAAIKVASKTSGHKIIVERAMYWNSQGAGTDTIGGFSD